MDKKYRHIYFDLDRTLWDFRKNSAETLLEMIGKFSLQEVIPDNDGFIEKYNYFNDRLWDYYRLGRIKKIQLRNERFRLLLKEYGVTDSKLIRELSHYYLNISPAKTALIPGTVELLEYLSKKYDLYILSNGFYDVQLTKMINSGISRYFRKLFTSDRIGYAKPDTRIFNYAVNSVNARKEESIMVGDDERIDIEGARNARIDQVLFNPGGTAPTQSATFVIRSLQELKKHL